jgi:hypothetical protein
LLTCLKTQTVNSIPNCFNLDVVPLPVKFKNSRNQRKISIRASGHTLSMKLRKFINEDKSVSAILDQGVKTMRFR